MIIRFGNLNVVLNTLDSALFCPLLIPSELVPKMHLLALGILAGLLLVIAGVSHLIRLFKQLNHHSRGPGPTLIPYMGRVHDLPIQYTWLKLKEWADQYGRGGFYRLQVLGTHFLVITDEKIAEQLLVKRAKYNSDRPAVQSLFDPKSTHGSMEYLPLMGKNGEPRNKRTRPPTKLTVKQQNTGPASENSPMPTLPKPPMRVITASCTSNPSGG